MTSSILIQDSHFHHHSHSIDDQKRMNNDLLQHSLLHQNRDFMKDYNRGQNIDYTKNELKSCVTDFKTRLSQIDVADYLGQEIVVSDDPKQRMNSSKMQFLSKTNLPNDSKIVKLQVGVSKIIDDQNGFNNKSILEQLQKDKNQDSRYKTNLKKRAVFQLPDIQPISTKNFKDTYQNNSMNTTMMNNTDTVNTPNKKKNRLNAFLTERNEYNQTISILNQKESCENLQQVLNKSKSIRIIQGEDESNSVSPKGLWSKIRDGNVKVKNFKIGSKANKSPMGSVLETSIQLENDQSGIFITDTSRLIETSKVALETARLPNIKQDRNLSMDLKTISFHQNSSKFNMKNIQQLDLSDDILSPTYRQKNKSPVKTIAYRDIIQGTQTLFDKNFTISDEQSQKVNTKKFEFRQSSMNINKPRVTKRGTLKLDHNLNINSSLQLHMNNQRLMAKIQSNIQEAKDIRSYLNQSISKIKEDLHYESIEDKIKQFQMFGANAPVKPRIGLKMERARLSSLNMSTDQISPKNKKSMLGQKKQVALNIQSDRY
ncbi:UNKNOWN [Stylonychia lemnae]|uniref:Uncharacterized protein n=1 Tax=Stylonychia lemnae TaxID=5949 RepID=A0A078A7E7_STYLE|nr:UNKNOWN [Stylonychia lemnae]|eukprot:CDW77796.1 UNKNOWN [Stylonychia lemnae]